MRLIWALVAVAVVAGACGGAEEPAAPPDVVVFGPWVGSQSEPFHDALRAFEERSGLAVRYVGTQSFAARVGERLREGDAPDVALFPQPSLIASLARADQIVPLPPDVVDVVAANYSEEVAQVGAVDGTLMSVVYRANVKSLVWYPPAEFAEHGYEVPRTWEEMLALTRQIEADGRTPWCIGMEAFGATGWVGTDWIEDIMLRMHGPEVYDRWTSGDITFLDDRVRDAFVEFSDVALAPRRVRGGPRAILSVPVSRALDPMLNDPPACLLHRQANFIRQDLPEDLEIGPEGDLDVFVLPTMGAEGAPLLIGGNLAAAFNDDPGTQALMAYLATPESGEPWAAVGQYISPHSTFDPEAYATDFDVRMAALLSEAEVIRFDGSDLMDPAVGTGTFWSGIVELISTGDVDASLVTVQSGYR